MSIYRDCNSCSEFFEKEGFFSAGSNIMTIIVAVIMWPYLSGYTLLFHLLSSDV